MPRDRVSVFGCWMTYACHIHCSQKHHRSTFQSIRWICSCAWHGFLAPWVLSYNGNRRLAQTCKEDKRIVATIAGWSSMHHISWSIPYRTKTRWYGLKIGNNYSIGFSRPPEKYVASGWNSLTHLVHKVAWYVVLTAKLHPIHRSPILCNDLSIVIKTDWMLKPAKRRLKDRIPISWARVTNSFAPVACNFQLE